MCFRMSLAEFTIPIVKKVGAACGFTLIRNSCTINKIVRDDVAVRELKPGDLILRINGIEVNEVSIRVMLREFRDLGEMSVTIARATYYEDGRYEAQKKALRMNSPTGSTRKGCFCFFPNKDESCTSSDEDMPKESMGFSKNVQISRRQSSTLSRVSVSSAQGMRQLDLRKMTKEGAGTMWKADRSGSLK